MSKHVDGVVASRQSEPSASSTAHSFSQPVACANVMVACTFGVWIKLEAKNCFASGLRVCTPISARV